jgi:hypothetical protein
MSKKVEPVTRHFTEKEAENAVYEHEVDRYDGENRRWSRSVLTIVDIDGHYYRIPWEEGLTEYQESEFTEGDYEEVRKNTVVVAQSETTWMPVNAPDNNDRDRENMRDYVSMIPKEARTRLKEAIIKAESGDYAGLHDVNATDGMSAMVDVIERYRTLITILGEELDKAE